MRTKRSDGAEALTQAHRWAAELGESGEVIGKRFPRAEPRQRAITYVQGLLSSVGRKNGWQLAEEAGDPTPYARQPLLGRAVWSAEEVRDEVQTLNPRVSISQTASESVAQSPTARPPGSDTDQKALRNSGGRYGRAYPPSSAGEGDSS
jgi:hypothetical protein